MTIDTEPREPSRLPIRGTIAAAGTLGALALLLSLRGGSLAPSEAVVSADASEPQAIDEFITGAVAETSGAADEVDPTVELEATALGEAPALAVEDAGVVATDEVGSEIVTATGEAVAIRWGDVQVAITVQGDDIIGVETLAIPLDDRKSQRINSNAEPVLREEALAIDSADVSVVSGATYTSRAYATSLQSALDQLGS